jgi:hypothetical protein
MTLRVRALGEEEAAELARMVRSRTLGAGLVRRAQIVRHRQVVRLRLRRCAQSGLGALTAMRKRPRR